MLIEQSQNLLKMVQYIHFSGPTTVTTNIVALIGNVDNMPQNVF